MRPTIDWARIGLAVACYRSMGYKYVEVPWIVSTGAVAATLPSDRRNLVVDGLGSLVGSAEQSFIHMMERGDLRPGRYVAVSPCFRDENDGDLHQPSFMKVELIHALHQPASGTIRMERVRDVINDALAFFRTVHGATSAHSRCTHEGEDIVLNGIEIGSYGYRERGGVGWVYGTGCAEPRTSMAIERVKPARGPV